MQRQPVLLLAQYLETQFILAFVIELPMHAIPTMAHATPACAAASLAAISEGGNWGGCRFFEYAYFWGGRQGKDPIQVCQPK